MKKFDGRFQRDSKNCFFFRKVQEIFWKLGFDWLGWPRLVHVWLLLTFLMQCYRKYRMISWLCNNKLAIARDFHFRHILRAHVLRLLTVVKGCPQMQSIWIAYHVCVVLHTSNTITSYSIIHCVTVFFNLSSESRWCIDVL